VLREVIATGESAARTHNPAVIRRDPVLRLHALLVDRMPALQADGRLLYARIAADTKFTAAQRASEM
jgi:hypothetical protein